MTWIVLHWVFLFICKPHALFHAITAILLYIFQSCVMKKKLQWKKDLQVTLGVVLMYIGFYISGELWHFSFLPFWGISIIGLRSKIATVVIFGIVTGLALHFIILKEVLAHVVMNIGRLIRIRNVTLNTTIISHTILAGIGPLIQYRSIVFTRRELLAVISTIHMIDKNERMDIFSLCMCYTHFFALLVPLLHLLALNWFNYYENNHFYLVKRQYLFVIPIGILVERLIYAIL